MDRLADANALVIRQQRELMEAFTGLETRNRYVVEDDK
ncbi:MAG: phospholipid scramblase-related protein, partial [Bacteroidota bacterium]